MYNNYAVGEAAIRFRYRAEYAGVAELADAPDLGSGIARCEGSSPFARKKTSFVVRQRGLFE